ncbi:hypothetical protein OKW21_000726 [Catalinimonas alkaloidigena]|uniref:hypothetical protein n=1 Tax=Catalinimonas alkaloidigena TaxID=1075417 RepID=UPI002407547B|nr:hypothetical protein [Catalinimonas alkaloidigena]MDF9795463.1 hypothetical protein [Catalinimonas alkaloidigena]
MKTSEKMLKDYFSGFKSKKVILWIVVVGVVIAYGMDDSTSSAPQQAPYATQQPYAPAAPQSSQNGQYAPERQMNRSNLPAQPMRQAPQNQTVTQAPGNAQPDYNNGGYPTGTVQNSSSYRGMGTQRAPY